MSKLVINGRKRLVGEVAVGGSKNSSVALIPAALLADDECVIESVPRYAMFKFLPRYYRTWVP
jgi:UDP-N-acetylglucosamine 1-carboxyvinyltransferase